jgi:hypothetical protein
MQNDCHAFSAVPFHASAAICFHLGFEIGETGDVASVR